MKERYEGFMRDVPCPVCEGTRLKPEILAVTMAAGEHGQVHRRGLRTVHRRLLGLPQRAHPRYRARQAIAGQVLKEMQSRLGFLLDVGLDYLSLSRAAGTLSGGEAQRIRLATQIGSGLVGVLYVLDEPSHRPASARQPPAHRHARSGYATSATRSSSSSTTRTPSRTPTGSSTSARPPASTVAASCTAVPTPTC